MSLTSELMNAVKYHRESYPDCTEQLTVSTNMLPEDVHAHCKALERSLTGAIFAFHLAADVLTQHIPDVSVREQWKTYFENLIAELQEHKA